MKTEHIATLVAVISLVSFAQTENDDNSLFKTEDYFSPLFNDFDDELRGDENAWEFNENADERVEWTRLTELAKRSPLPFVFTSGIGPSRCSDCRLVPAVEKLSDQDLLAEIAKAHDCARVRLAAVEKLTDQRLLTQITKGDPDEWVRGATKKRLEDLTNQIARGTLMVGAITPDKTSATSDAPLSCRPACCQAWLWLLALLAAAGVWLVVRHAGRKT